MNSIRVDKGKLVETITLNREKHRKDFEESVREFRAATRKKLKQMLKKVRPDDAPVSFSQKLKPVAIDIPAPTHHLEDYDRVLEMLGMSVDNQIELQERDFESFVLDRWSWRQGFDMTKAFYASAGGAAAAAAPGEDDEDPNQIG